MRGEIKCLILMTLAFWFHFFDVLGMRNRVLNAAAKGGLRRIFWRAAAALKAR